MSGTTAEVKIISPKESLTKITVGIRHQRNFGIMDSSGKIVDAISRSNDTPFPKEFFTQISEGATRERRLQTKDGSSYLMINTDDLIFQYSFEESFEEAFTWVVEQCVPYFVKNILHRYGVTDFFRLGMVFGHRLPAPDFISDMATSMTSSKLANPETMIFRVSKKLLVEQALVKKNVQDWRNVILTVNKMESQEMDIDVDIQHYFNPFPTHLEEYDYSAFFRFAKDILFSTYHPILEEKFFSKKIEAK